MGIKIFLAKSRGLGEDRKLVDLHFDDVRSNNYGVLQPVRWKPIWEVANELEHTKDIVREDVFISKICSQCSFE